MMKNVFVLLLFCFTSNLSAQNFPEFRRFFPHIYQEPSISTAPQMPSDKEKTEDKTLSPYFIVKTATSKIDALPLKSTTADVKIAGMIADVTVHQTYKNTGTETLECLYVFPASTRAAVYAMQMKVGKKVINARIREKKQAKKEYDNARAAGKTASLLEQNRPNVFQMNVANIRPNEEVEVTLQYTEMIIPTEGVYQFVYPTVVGPRYNSKEKTEDVTTPYLKKGEPIPYVFDIKVALTSGVPIQNPHSLTHWIDLTKTDDYHTIAQLKKEDGGRGNKDFVLNYELKGAQMQSGIMLYEHNDEKFFMAMVQPQKAVATDQIPPREYIFVVDVSGSMNGFPLQVSKTLLKNLVGNLRKNDYFNVILFAGVSSLLSEKSLPATEQSIENAFQLIDNQQGSGATELLPAMQRALALPRSETGLSRSMVLITDGFIDVEKESFELIRSNLNQCNVFAFGIGSSVNRHLMEGLAHVGQGEPFIVLDETEAPKVAEKFRQYINTPVLSQVKYKMKGFNAYDIEPANLPDVMAERPIILFGKYKGAPTGTIEIEGYSGKKLVTQTINIAQNTPDIQNSALRYLWAREKLRYLDDFVGTEIDSNQIKEVVNIGLKYNLLTAHTSFIAVDETPVTDKNGKIISVKQGLPLPEGVENTAVGADFDFEAVFEMGGSGTPFMMWIGVFLGALTVFFFVKKLF